jgi:hypothetical protein
MKIWMVCASALVLVSACGSSKEATAALAAMQLADGKSGMVKYEAKSGSGDKVTLKDVVIGPGDGSGIKAKSMILDGLDMTDAQKPVVTSITLKDITPEKETPGVTFKLASMAIVDANPEVGEFLASAFTEAGPGTAPAFEKWSFGKISINGMTLNGDLAAMGMGGGKFNVLMDEFSASSLKNTVFGGAHMGGLKGDFDVPAEATGGVPVVGKFDFGTADIKNLRGGMFATAFEAGMNSAMNPEAASTVEADILKSMTSPIDPSYDSMTWSGMNIEASGAKLTVSKTSADVKRNADGVAVAVSSPRATINFTADAAGGQIGQMAGMGLSAIGYPSIELYGGGEATFDPATDTTRYTNYNFGLTDGFDISMKGGMQGVKDALVALVGAMSSYETMMTQTVDENGNPVAPAAPDMSGLEKLKIVDLDLTITDKSFVNKMLALAPMMGSQDAETLRTDLVNMISSMGADLSGSGIDQALANELTTAVANFIKSPGMLSIKMAPATPVALAAPDQTVTKESLGFSATATPGAP